MLTMKKEQISPMLLAYSIGCLIQASSLMLFFAVGVVKQDSWFIVLIGFMISLLLIRIYSSLAENYPGKSLIEMNDCIFGNVLGKVFSIFYIFYFFSLAFLNSRILGEFIVGMVMPETPMPAILILFIIICIWSVRKGVETMLRCSALFFLVAAIFIILNGMLLLKDMDFSNFLPVFSYPFSKYLKATFQMVMIPYSEVLVFMMFLPALPQKTNVKKVFYTGLTLGGISTFVIILRNTAVAGSVLAMFSSPSYNVIRLVNVGHTLTRLEVTYAVLLIALQFFKVSVMLYATTFGIAQMLHLKSYKMLVPVTGVLTVCFAFISFDSAIAHAYWGMSMAAPYTAFFALILPLVSFLTSFIKKLFKLREVEAS